MKPSNWFQWSFRYTIGDSAISFRKNSTEKVIVKNYKTKKEYCLCIVNEYMNEQYGYCTSICIFKCSRVRVYRVRVLEDGSERLGGGGPVMVGGEARGVEDDADGDEEVGERVADEEGDAPLEELEPARARPRVPQRALHPPQQAARALLLLLPAQRRRALRAPLRRRERLNRLLRIRIHFARLHVLYQHPQTLHVCERHQSISIAHYNTCCTVLVRSPFRGSN